MGRRGSRGWRQSCGSEGGLALNAIRESRVRRFSAGFLTGSARTLIVCLVELLGRHLFLSAQTLHYTKRPDVSNAEKVYKGGCIACHGSEGKGAPATSTVFLRPDTGPDLTDYAGTALAPHGTCKDGITHAW